MKVIRFEDAIVTEWSGGKTHEIFIHPQESNFKSGDYELRISVATVNVEESTFSSLPNVNRILTVLEGELKLNHEGHHISKLEARVNKARKMPKVCIIRLKSQIIGWWKSSIATLPFKWQLKKLYDGAAPLNDLS